MAAFLLNSLFWQYVTRRERILYQARNFYGVLKVTMAPESGQPLVRLTNGTTSHGVQLYHRDYETLAAIYAPVAALAPANLFVDTLVRYIDREPLSYYHQTGPIGQVFAEFSGPRAKKEVAVIGLGAGTLASYGEPGQMFWFFDIDPTVAEIAGALQHENAQSYFTYLADCRAKWDVILGDARLRMKVAEDGEFQLMVVDAFNSDAIPVHLLTREALQLYFQKLSKDGILALHISNRYLRLEPVLGNLAKDLHLVGLFQHDHDFANKPGKRASEWVLLAHRLEDFGSLSRGPRSRG